MFYSLFKEKYFLDFGNFWKSSYLYNRNMSHRKKLPQKDYFYLNFFLKKSLIWAKNLTEFNRLLRF